MTTGERTVPADRTGPAKGSLEASNGPLGSEQSPTKPFDNGKVPRHHRPRLARDVEIRSFWCL